jgi:hypothetical protein
MSDKKWPTFHPTLTEPCFCPWCQVVNIIKKDSNKNKTVWQLFAEISSLPIIWEFMYKRRIFSCTEPERGNHGGIIPRDRGTCRYHNVAFTLQFVHWTEVFLTSAVCGNEKLSYMSTFLFWGSDNSVDLYLSTVVMSCHTYFAWKTRISSNFLILKCSQSICTYMTLLI